MENIKTILSGANSTYLLALLEQYHHTPESVPADWRPILEELATEYGLFEKRPTWGGSIDKASYGQTEADARKEAIESTTHTQTGLYDIQLHTKVFQLIQAYRTHGHLQAKLDPLNLQQPEEEEIAQLNPNDYHFSDMDYNKSVYVGGAFGAQFLLLSELLTRLKQAYCGILAAEYMHIQNPNEVNFFQHHVEQNSNKYTIDAKKDLLQSLLRAELGEQFLHKKFPGNKRFGLDGGESLIPALNHMITLSVKQGVDTIVIGMPHRGRLATLAGVIQKPLSNILAAFMGKNISEDTLSGDVQYHAGFSSIKEINAQQTSLVLLPNPSHLEAVNTVVLGHVYKLQKEKNDAPKTKILGVLIHGDAAFSGQGIVFETLNLSGLESYKTGGTIHIIINNQIGFTTPMQKGRFYPHCTDIAKAIQAPIIHVNADEPEAVLQAMEMACLYRQKFKKDIIINFTCYRKYGHNEGDEPLFTQPLMYSAIHNHQSVAQKYEHKLLEDGHIKSEDAQVMRDNVHYELTNAFNEAQKIEAQKPGKSSTKTPIFKEIITGIQENIIFDLAQKLYFEPKGFHLHPKIKRLWNEKIETIQAREPFDWHLGETFALATCLMEGHSVRLSGQDCERGTFSHRHAVVIDQKTGQSFTPLTQIAKAEVSCEIINSPLSEYAVLGFEYGHSIDNAKTLNIWEAQFGDFANGGQIIIDQFLASGHAKWGQESNLVLLLPHGYEGQGPEHSSARLERFLQLCGNNNMTIANCTTPANYFHALRKQVKAPCQKPLIILTPKSLLRHKKCTSALSDFGPDTAFQPVIFDDLPVQKMHKIILCTGKIYYDLLDYRQNNAIDDVAIIRLEQLYPFPENHLIKLLKTYQEIPVIWCQEEPKNMGAWPFLEKRLEHCLTQVRGSLSRPLYVGREEAASPATGYAERHKTEQETIIKQAFSVLAMKPHLSS